MIPDPFWLSFAGEPELVLQLYVVTAADARAAAVEAAHKAQGPGGPNPFLDTCPDGTYRTGQWGETTAHLQYGNGLVLYTPDYRPDGGRDVEGWQVKTTEKKWRRHGVNAGFDPKLYDGLWMQSYRILPDGSVWVGTDGWIERDRYLDLRYLPNIPPGVEPEFWWLDDKHLHPGIPPR